MHLYQRLRDIREDNEKTQAEIASLLGLYQTHYSRYERGEREPDISTLCSLADYFEVSIDKLIGYINKHK